MSWAEDAEIEEWCTLMWALWRERNAQLFNDKKAPEDEIALRSHLWLEEYQRHQVSFENPATNVDRDQEKRWTRPNRGCTSVATDAATKRGNRSRSGYQGR
ncbi:unnamed protein product [Linum trigynum]|uniref:Uncharacterized protein n=1 Tax=Linum trigynum TaxID=586398 RepID=A0AAV2G6S0_9ROSI